MSHFKIATWNVNSLRVRLQHVLDWIQAHAPDVMVLQETKILDEDFPLAEFQKIGYQAVFSGQKTYNGVAILSKEPVLDVVKDFPSLDDHQRRVLAGTVSGIRVLNLYVPNGENVFSLKYEYKLNWLSHLDDYLKNELKRYPNMIILGDFNIAPSEIDVHDPALWEGHVLFSEKERMAFQEILKLGFYDTFRHANPEEKAFTWWDYRMNGFKRNLGLRIDHILSSSSLLPSLTSCIIDRSMRSLERPSDHAPVMAEFALK